MLRKTLIVPLFATSALALAAATPALADKQDHARESVAAAEAKVQTALQINAGADSPGELDQAKALLANAKEDFKSDHEEQAIREANQAAAFADTAIAVAQKHRDEAVASAHASQRATANAAEDQVAAARDQAADAQGQIVAAQQQAAAAQQQAAEANARADAAQQAAAASAADANAARDAAAQAETAKSVQTTVTTRQAVNTRHPVHRKVVSTTTTGSAPAAEEVTTTTTKVSPQ